MSDCNVLGGALEQGGTDPLTGFYRDGCCATGPEDLGWSGDASRGNRLGTPSAPS
ncbi:Uncharacterized protein conserved in bacteria [Mycobacterium tuberculosis]|nr:Uncharacterized protein conserved in bacteria [Mycobacterium tuberculosis]